MEFATATEAQVKAIVREERWVEIPKYDGEGEPFVVEAMKLRPGDFDGLVEIETTPGVDWTVSIRDLRRALHLVEVENGTERTVGL